MTNGTRRSIVAALARDPFVLAFGCAFAVELAFYIGPLVSDDTLRAFGQSWFLVPFLAILTAGTFAGSSSAGTRDERRFWRALGASFAIWLAAAVIYAQPDPDVPHWDLLVDLPFLLAYLPLLIAVESRPHQGTARTGQDPDRWTHVVSVTAVVASFFVYVVVLPAWYDQRFYWASLPIYLFILTFDIGLAALYISVGRQCGSPRWRVIYLAVAAGSLTMGVTDTLDLLHAASALNWGSGTLTDLVWAAPPFVYLVAVRLRHAPLGPATADEIRETGYSAEERKRSGAVAIAGAFSLPLFHFWLHNLFELDPALARAQSLFVLVVLLVLGAGAQGIYVWLERRHRTLALAARSLEARLQESQRLEATGRLAGGVAHDFNNLLTTIVGYNDLALEALPADDPNRFALEEIQNAGARAAALTSQLLAFSRRQILKPERVGLNHVVSSSGPVLARVIGEDIRLETSLDPEAGDVMADPAQLQSVLFFLAAYARDTMPTGGVLSLRTARVGPPAAPLDVAQLVVSDSGPGIPADLHARIFEPFSPVFRHEKGRGLSLAAVHGIVSQSGGTIEIVSEPGRGTAFAIRLPRLPDGGPS